MALVALRDVVSVCGHRYRLVFEMYDPATGSKTGGADSHLDWWPMGGSTYWIRNQRVKAGEAGFSVGSRDKRNSLVLVVDTLQARDRYPAMYSNSDNKFRLCIRNTSQESLI